MTDDTKTSETPRTDALEEKWRYATEARGNLNDALDDLFNEYAELERENAELRRDRERLDSGRIKINGFDEFGEPCATVHNGIDLRAAIDAAMKEGE